ncbi:glycosyltransferase family 4 protein [Halopelagius fulvigenes]|uniref:Glycosyltransferase family 4 protein n=1 Tax=Halopelagius fulvigenes TaxID=1198324 RepID=A0ABD5U120_9EURY
MSRIAVAHTDLTAKGGGEGVCMNVLAALEGRHDVTLLTLTSPDIDALNRYFDTDVGDVTVRRPPVVESLLERTDLPLYNLENAFLSRFVDSRADEFDLVISTDNEISPSIPAIQYVHTPRFGRLVTSKRVGEDSFVDHLYDRLAYRVGGFDAEEIRNSRLLTNSRWMANIVQDVYGVRPEVVYPPVDTSGFDPAPWEEREDGFVTVGRITSYKNVKDAVRIVDGVRERGHDVHHHVVGPPTEEAYAAEVKEMADDREYVTVEGEMPREELEAMLSTHKWGLHAKRHEHFGMAVAELVAAGTVAFVPDNGGQQDIVEGRDELMYRTTEEAVEKVHRILSDDDLREEVRQTPDTIEERFGRDRFREEVRALAAEELDGRA